MWYKDHNGSRLSTVSGRGLVYQVGDRYRASVQPLDASWRVLGYADTLEDGQAMCERALSEIVSQYEVKEFKYLVTGALITIIVVGLLMLQNWGAL